MPFPFSHVCDLLDDLRQLHVRPHPLLPALLQKKRLEQTSRWLKDWKDELNAFNTQSDAALWMLRPDKLGDRHYGISAKTLQLIIARTYLLSKEEMKVLRRWETQKHLGDLAVCVGDVREAMQGIPSPTKINRVTVEEIQNTMLRIASTNPESSLAVRSLSRDQNKVNPIQLLEHIYNRLGSREAKWMTRYILKDYGAVFLPDSWTWESGYFGLPNCAPIKFDLFTRDPPVEILDGTKRVKATAETRAAAEKKRIETEGWLRPAPRSRESSPIARPRVKLAKPAPLPEPSRGRPEISSSRSRDSSPESSIPMIWATGVLKPNPKRKRTEITATPVQQPVKVSSKSTVNLLQPIPNASGERVSTPKGSPATTCSLLRSSGLNTQAKDPRTNLSAAMQTPSTLVKGSRTSSMMAISPGPRPSRSAMKTPIFIDLTESPLRSGYSTTTTLVASSTQKELSSSSIILTKFTSSATTLVASSAIEHPSPLRSALSNLPSKAASCNQRSPRPSSRIPSPKYSLSNPLITAGSGKCRLGKLECPLIRCIVLLSPSLVKDDRLINQYLAWHGLRYMTNLKALSHPQLPNCCPSTKLRYRKMVLVDMDKPKETATFLSEIEDLNLQHRVKRGKRDVKGNEWTKEYVEVYDWKILEVMGKVDRGKKYNYDPWQRCLVLPI